MSPLPGPISTGPSARLSPKKTQAQSRAATWGDDEGTEGDGGALARPLHQAKLCLGEAQPWHLAVGQTCNTQGLEELRSPHKPSFVSVAL
jgi:hypothetical protein